MRIAWMAALTLLAAACTGSASRQLQSGQLDGGASQGNGGVLTSPSAGCGKPVAATGSVALTATDANGTARTYEVEVPAPYRADQPLPVVFYFHGQNGNIQESKGYSQFLAVPEMVAGALIVYPQGIGYTDPQGVDWGVGWDGTPSCGGRDLAFFDAMLEHVKSTYCIDSNRVFVSGFSWGTDFADALACCRTSKIRALSVGSGDEVLVWNPRCVDLPTLPALRLTYATNDAYTQAQFDEKIGVFKHGLGCSSASTSASDNLGGTNAGTCKSYQGCAKPLVECVYPNMAHRLPSNFGVATWAFFSSFH